MLSQQHCQFQTSLKDFLEFLSNYVFAKTIQASATKMYCRCVSARQKLEKCYFAQTRAE